MGFHSRSSILSSTVCRWTGRPSLTTSSAIGRPTRSAHTSTSFVRVFAETPPLVLGIPAGVGLRNCEREQPNRCSTLMSRGQSQNPPTPGFHGCDIFGAISATEFIFGRLTVERATRLFCDCRSLPSLMEQELPLGGTELSPARCFLSYAEWMRREDARGTLTQFFTPELQPNERKTAEVEGWILGIT